MFTGQFFAKTKNSVNMKVLAAPLSHLHGSNSVELPNPTNDNIEVYAYVVVNVPVMKTLLLNYFSRERWT
jgi:hypothetical protein